MGRPDPIEPARKVFRRELAHAMNAGPRCPKSSKAEKFSTASALSQNSGKKR